MATIVTDFISKDIFKIISNTANAMDVRAYVVGEYVRDCYLNRHNNHIEIVVEGNSLEFGKTVASNAHVQASYFKNFGVAIINYKGDKISFTEAKKRRAKGVPQTISYVPGKITDDLQLRDFTINAMAISLNDSDFGSLIDIFDGLSDIAQGFIITPLSPQSVIQYNPIVMLRAVRLSVQLSTPSKKFRLASGCMDAIWKYSEKVESIAKERVSEELNAILLSDAPGSGFRLLEELGILKRIIPALSATKGVKKIDGIGHEDSFPHALMVLDNIARMEAEQASGATNSLGIKQGEPNLWLRWAAILHEVGKPVSRRFVRGRGWTFYGYDVVGSKMIPKIFSSLRMPLNEKMRYVQNLIALQNRPKTLLEAETSESAYRRLLFDAGDDIWDLMLLCQANVTTSNRTKAEKEHGDLGRVQQLLTEVKEKEAVRNFKNPISANYIMDLYGLEPCNILGRLKDIIKKAILDGEIENTFEDADALLRRKAAEMGLKIKEGLPSPASQSPNSQKEEVIKSVERFTDVSSHSSNGIRVNKILREFNIGLSTLEDFLRKKGYEEAITVTTKISEETYVVIANEFSKDPYLKEEARDMAVELTETVKENQEEDSDCLQSGISTIVRSLYDNSVSRLLLITNALSQHRVSEEGPLVVDSHPSGNEASKDAISEESLFSSDGGPAISKEREPKEDISDSDNSHEDLSIQPDIVWEEKTTLTTASPRTYSLDIIRSLEENGISNLYLLLSELELNAIRKGQALIKDRFTLFTHDFPKETHNGSYITLKVDLRVIALPGVIISFEEFLTSGITLCTEVSSIMQIEKDNGIHFFLPSIKRPLSILSSCVVIVPNSIPFDFIINSESLNSKVAPSLPF